MRFPDVLSLVSGPSQTTYDERDAILYALGVGAGLEDLDEGGELPMVYERDLRVLPTFATTLLDASGDLFGRAGVDARKVVHSEQRLTMHHPLAPRARVATRSRVLGVADKGADKGAVVWAEHAIADAQSGLAYATVVLTLYCRGDGGFGGPAGELFPLHRLPERDADRTWRQRTPANQAALYRQAVKDTTTLHIDPAAARAVGFERPLLHGLCTYGFACRAVLQDWCGSDPSRLRTFDVRFAAPFFPGETLVVRSWKDGPVISFEGIAQERGVSVLRNGRCEVAE